MDLNDLITIRRHFHQFPEVGFEEKKTTKELLELTKNLNCKRYFGKALYEDELKEELSDISFIDDGFTGLLLEFAGKKPYILIRADIDGLPVKESDDNSHFPKSNNFESKNENRMHACGHDGHMALALSLANYVNKKELTNGVRILFQPAEEGVRGATSMGDWVTRDINKAIGYHIGLGQEKHTIGVGSTNFLAAKKIELTFYGKSAHSANDPQNGICAFSLAAAFYELSLQLIRDRSEIKMLNIGTVNGGLAKNAVMESITLGMDIRASSDKAMDELFNGIKKIAQGVTEARGANYELKVVGECVSYKEDDIELVDLIEKSLNEASINTTSLPDFGASEDVTLFLQKAKDHGGKGIHLLLGTDLKGSHHSSTFDYDDSDLIFFDKAIKIVFDKLYNLEP